MRKGISRRAVVRNYLNKQYRTGNDKQSRKTQINDIAPVNETSSKDGVFSNVEKTKDTQIDFSLYEEGDQPTDYNKSLRYIRYDDLAPIKEDIKKPTTNETVKEDIAPTKEQARFKGHSNIEKMEIYAIIKEHFITNMQLIRCNGHIVLLLRLEI